MTPELTALTLAGLLQVIQYALMSIPANLELGTGKTLSPRDREICERIGPFLREAGLIFAGIDVIGRYLTEINVTSPTGVQEAERFSGTNIAALFWDAVEARLEARA